jgi:hypothetical protein
MGNPTEAARRVPVPEGPKSKERIEVTSGRDRTLGFYAGSRLTEDRFHCYGMATVLPPVGAVKGVALHIVSQAITPFEAFRNRYFHKSAVMRPQGPRGFGEGCTIFGAMGKGKKVGST